MNNSKYILCFDGTENELDGTASNVLKLARFLKKSNTQIVFYDPGVGTLATGVMRKVKEKFQSATGHGLQQNLLDGYTFLMENYRAGGKVYLFGFSRGAYTARALAGFIYRVGLLKKQHKNLLPYALDAYNNKDFKVMSQLRGNFSNDCSSHFIGVWDTVGSLIRIASKYEYYDTSLNPDTEYGYHAVSIDEKRKRFPVTLWNLNNRSRNQTIEQIWFAGVHSDVGGGYKEAGLSDITLQWMINKASMQGLQFINMKGLINPDAFGQIHDERKKKLHWRLSRPVDRPMPDDAKQVHPTVYQRVDNKKLNYKPKNLP